MTVYQAIHQMRALSAQKKTFAVSFMTYSRERGQSHGVVAIEHASVVKHPERMAAAGSPAPAACQDYMLTLRDHNALRTVQIWQPLLLSYNHQPLSSVD